MKVISIINKKGGSGKTQAAIHLAWEGRVKHRVALLDLDPDHQSVNWIKTAQMPIDAVSINLRETDFGAYVAQIEASGDYDLLIVDTPANDMNATMEALLVADAVVVPVGAGTSDVGMLATTNRQITKAQQLRASEGKPPIFVRVLINRSRFAPAVTRETVADVRGYGMEVFEAQIPLSGPYQKSTGRPITAQQFHFAPVLKEILHALA